MIRCRARNVVPLAALMSMAAGLAACATDPVSSADGSAPLVVDRSTDEAGVTTVRNVSGSVWESPVRVEEIATIGGEETDEYLFAAPYHLHATAEMVVVADVRLTSVRAYDRNGGYLRTYGGPGQGPGEYQNLFGAGVLADGRVIALAFPTSVIYERDGTFSETWTVPTGDRGLALNFAPMIGADGSALWMVSKRSPGERREPQPGDRGYIALGPAGWEGEMTSLVWEPYESERIDFPCPNGQGDCFTSHPWVVRAQARMMPNLESMSGRTDSYRIRVVRPDGSELVIEHYARPAIISDSERRVAAAALEARVRSTVPGFEYGVGKLPSHKPAFLALLAPHDGRYYVARSGEGVWNAERCGPLDAWTPESGEFDCHDERIWIDVFAADGSFLGAFERPEGALVQNAHIADDEIWTYATDEIGNPVVKGYRLVLPDTDP